MSDPISKFLQLTNFYKEIFKAALLTFRMQAGFPLQPARPTPYVLKSSPPPQLLRKLKKKKPCLPLVGSRIYSVIYFPAKCSQCHCLWALVQKCRNEITDWRDLTQLPSHNPIISSFCHPHQAKSPGDWMVITQYLRSSFISTVQGFLPVSSPCLHSGCWRAGPGVSDS